VGGLVTDSLSFKMFGEELESGSGTVNPFWYGGQVGYFRDLPGVMNVGRRKLIAANGTFLNRDPIGFGGGDVNLVRYVGNNPVVRVDPSGLECDCTVTYIKAIPDLVDNGPCYNLVQPTAGNPAPLLTFDIIETCKAALYSEVKCTGCPCPPAPAPPAPSWKFYQWRQSMYNAWYPNGSVVDSPGLGFWGKYVNDTNTGGDGEQQTQLLSVSPLPGGAACDGTCSYLYTFGGCDAPGTHATYGDNDYGPVSKGKCFYHPPLNVAWARSLKGTQIGIGLVPSIPDRWFGYHINRRFCLGFGPSSAQAKTGAKGTKPQPWGILIGYFPHSPADEPGDVPFPLASMMDGDCSTLN
jgi:RHS repeat-associated protein